MEIDHGFASGAAVDRATTHSLGRPAARGTTGDATRKTMVNPCTLEYNRATCYTGCVKLSLQCQDIAIYQMDVYSLGVDMGYNYRGMWSLVPSLDASFLNISTHVLYTIYYTGSFWLDKASVIGCLWCDVTTLKTAVVGWHSIITIAVQMQPYMHWHYSDAIMGAMASPITNLTIVYSIVYSSADQRKYQSSASLSFVPGIHRWPANSPHKGPETRKMFPFDDVIMKHGCDRNNGKMT